MDSHSHPQHAMIEKQEPKGVTFADTVKVTRVPTISSYKLRERRTIWYNKEDYTTMNEARRQYKIGNVQHLSKEEQQCMLGITTIEESQMQRKRIDSARAQVFYEQQKQWDCDNYDYEQTLADVYVTYTMECKNLAMVKALLLEREILDSQLGKYEMAEKRIRFLSSSVMAPRNNRPRRGTSPKTKDSVTKTSRRQKLSLLARSA